MFQSLWSIALLYTIFSYPFYLTCLYKWGKTDKRKIGQLQEHVQQKIMGGERWWKT